ncbi:MAG: aminopeptidase N [Pseudomonadota bacterium]
MPKQQQTQKTTYLSDYQPTDYRVDSIDLHFDLHETKTIVKSKLSIQKLDNSPHTPPLKLNGEELLLKSVSLSGRQLSSTQYALSDESLTIPEVPESFELAIETEINPKANTALTGLYLSGGNFCTQCEAEGFRRITYMLDRPDVMARYTTTIVADKAQYPVLLANGNLCESGELGASRHWAKWEDPFPKPTYLFALVAGDLARIEDQFITQSGRQVTLQIYVQSHNIDKCQHAMQSLKKAMRWDEEVYGREYDLDIYMIVAVDDFNAGAMENKGLNIFNSKYVLAKPETATDSDYESIESVIAHEYFHNWSGNRVTCRDWFQLSLKEGFTVFRDQEFSADMTSRGVKRIQDVNILRTHQFREDASPMAHPVRPESYLEIDNFYTVTVYNKGAEVVRMLHHLLGAENFRKGTDCYFERHDGQAVTTDDFVKALEDANQMDLSQFRLWYSQAGTPELEISRAYNEAAKTYTLTVKQSTPGQDQNKPFHIPLAMSLLDKHGQDMPLQLQGESAAIKGTRVLHIRAAAQDFTFQNINEQPIPSLLRGFSAPVKVKMDLSDEERCFLMMHDSDDFNRWDASQQLAVKIMTQLVDDVHQNRALQVADAFIEAYQEILNNDTLDKALATQAITLPSESYLGEFMEPIDPVAIHQVRRFMRKTIAQRLSSLFLKVYHRIADEARGEYRIDQFSIKRRSLKNLCLSYLMELNDDDIINSCYRQFIDSNNMTDVMAALKPLANTDCAEREAALGHFYHQWKNEPLVVDKWLAIQANSHLPGTLDQVKRLTQHEAFDIKNPNKVRALIGAFAHNNHAQLHEISGVGYAFLTDVILQIDPINSQISSRLVKAYTLWRKYDVQRQVLLKQQLEKIADAPRLSKNVYEIVSKSLG